MNEFYEQTRQLNMKKVICIAVILIILIILIIILIINKSLNKKTSSNEQINEKSTIFYSNDNSISIELSNNLNLKNYNSNLGYLLELRSDNNLNIFISKENAIENKSLLEIVNADKTSFLSTFESSSNLSDIKELSVNNNPAFTYSFHYLDKVLSKAFYIQIAWLQIDNIYYIFDIEFPLNDLSFNTNIASNVLSSFKENK